MSLDRGGSAAGGGCAGPDATGFRRAPTAIAPRILFAFHAPQRVPLARTASFGLEAMRRCSFWGGGVRIVYARIARSPLEGHDLTNLRNGLPKEALDSELEGRRCARTATA